MDFESYCHLYEQTDVNWDPKSLPNKIQIHRHWVSYGPRDDSVMLLHNPQYCLTAKVKGSYGVIWLILSRHYYKKNQILSSKDVDALSLLVYDHTDGDIVLTHQSGLPVSKVVYTNYPHILVRLSIPGGVKRFTCVVSSVRNDPKRPTNYTLSVMATENVAPSLTNVPRFWPNVKRVKGNWEEATAGGSIDKIRAYRTNPMFLVTIRKKCRFRARLSTNRNLLCDVSFFHAFSREQIGPERKLADSGVYLAGFGFCQAEEIYPGNYIVVPSTKEKKELGAIILELECTQPFDVEVLR